MNDITDKPVLDDEEDEGVHVIGDDSKHVMIDFFEKCERRSKPVVIRPEMIIACENPGVFERLPDIYQLGINFAERWLNLCRGHSHALKCGACGTEIDCANGEHDNIGCFVVIFKHDLDPSVGGLVLGICMACSEKTDTELYSAVVKALGGSDSDLTYPDPNMGPTPWTEENPANMTVLNQLTQDTVGYLTQYRIDSDLTKYLEGCEIAIAAARKRLADLTAASKNKKVDVIDAPFTEQTEVAQADVNLLVGKD